MRSPGDHLWLLFSKYVNPGASFAFICVHRCKHAPVATSFKFVKTGPMLGKVRRLEKVYVTDGPSGSNINPGKPSAAPQPEENSLPFTVPRCHFPANAEIW